MVEWKEDKWFGLSKTNYTKKIKICVTCENIHPRQYRCPNHTPILSLVQSDPLSQNGQMDNHKDLSDPQVSNKQNNSMIQKNILNIDNRVWHIYDYKKTIVYWLLIFSAFMIISYFIFIYMAASELYVTRTNVSILYLLKNY